ncbi:Gp138 family membrane-puncturing spike protein [Serratia liquefaciens]|uniref:Gp138 family membrane-puncturing spike protein n=1 Tax=Serratia liquefaciens TaxID=614 RepID=UPI0039069FDD
MAQLRPVDDQEIHDLLLTVAKIQTSVSMPGTIKSFDPDNVTCVVEFSMFGRKANAPRGSTSVDRLKSKDCYYPLIQDVPVVFPRGGGCTLTFPVKAGDECLVIFSDRCLDFWWQNGETQNTSRKRLHSFSDAFVIPGPQSQAKKISDISMTAVQLRTDDGTAFVEVSTSGGITATTQGSMTVNAPNIILNGAVTINGPLTQGKGEAGGTATLLGPLGVDNDVTAAGISLQNHTHSGVQSGNNNTGKPQ